MPDTPAPASTTPNTPAQMRYIVLEVGRPAESGAHGSVQTIWAARVDRPDMITGIDFTLDDESIDMALEELFKWAHLDTDTEPVTVEFVTWNKDAFARLMQSHIWAARDSICFMSYFSALTGQTAQGARLLLRPHDMPTQGAMRIPIIARMFGVMLEASQTMMQILDTTSDVVQLIPKTEIK